jgi:acetolactate synthase regulatory subunit
MNTDSKTFHLRVEREGSADTLEAVLAVLRRAGAHLHSLRMAPGRHGVELHLRVHADGDVLQLCRTRLCNLIGIVKLRVLADGREPFRPRDAV